MARSIFDVMNMHNDDTSEKDYIRIKSEQAVTQEEEYAPAQIVSTAPHGTRDGLNFTQMQNETISIKDF